MPNPIRIHWYFVAIWLFGRFLNSWHFVQFSISPAALLKIFQCEVKITPPFDSLIRRHYKMRIFPFGLHLYVCVRVCDVHVYESVLWTLQEPKPRYTNICSTTARTTTSTTHSFDTHHNNNNNNTKKKKKAEKYTRHYWCYSALHSYCCSSTHNKRNRQKRAQKSMWFNVIKKKIINGWQQRSCEV